MDERCKNVPIKVCCNEMANVIMLNDVRESILFFDDEPKGSPDRFQIWWKDCDCTPLVYCPTCGRKVEELE